MLHQPAIQVPFPKEAPGNSPIVSIYIERLKSDVAGFYLVGQGKTVA